MPNLRIDPKPLEAAFQDIEQQIAAFNGAAEADDNAKRKEVEAIAASATTGQQIVGSAAAVASAVAAFGDVLSALVPKPTPAP